jgi:hypothetical protein
VLKQAAPNRVGKRGIHGVKLSGTIFNHLVEDTPPSLSLGELEYNPWREAP